MKLLKIIGAICWVEIFITAILYAITKTPVPYIVHILATFCCALYSVGNLFVK